MVVYRLMYIFTANMAELSLDMFRSGFDSHLRMQNFEIKC